MKVVLLMAWCLSQFYYAVCCGWNDPHEMISGAKLKLQEKLRKSSSPPDLEVIRHISSVQPLDLNIYNIHFKRIINILMKAANIDKSDPRLYHGHLMFDITPGDFKYLLDLKNEELDVDTLRRVDTIFSESFSKTLVESYLEDLMTIQSKLYATISNIHHLWLLGTCFMLYVVYQLFRTNFSFIYILKYLIIIVFVVDFGLRYKVLMEEAEEHNLNVQYSPLCDTTKMGWTDYFLFLTDSRDCERRAVTPLDAFLFQAKHIIIVPMNAFGTGMGGFVANMYKTTPWGFGLLLLPVMLIFSLAVFIFVMAFMTDKAIEFNCFHLFKLKFGTSGSRDSKLTSKTVERLIDRVLHRPIVQDIGAADYTGEMNPLEWSNQDRREEQVHPKGGASQKKSDNINHLSIDPNNVVIEKNKSMETIQLTNAEQTKNRDNKLKLIYRKSTSSDIHTKSSSEDNVANDEASRLKTEDIDSFNTIQAKLDASTSTHLEEIIEDYSKGTQTQFMKYDL